MKKTMLFAALALAGAVAFAQPAYFDSDLTPEFREWRTANPWFGKDAKRTEFARNYARQLQKEKPDLVGRPLFDAVSAKVNETFGPAGKAPKK